MCFVCLFKFGVIYGTQVALDYMSVEKGGKGGMIVNVSSICGFDYFYNLPSYVASKHGVVGYTRCMAHENFATIFGVKFVTICPGVTDTSLIGDFSKLIYHQNFLEDTVQAHRDRGYQTYDFFQNYVPISNSKCKKIAFFLIGLKFAQNP